MNDETTPIRAEPPARRPDSPGQRREGDRRARPGPPRPPRPHQTYSGTMRAVTECRLFVLPASDFATMMRDWFPMAMHLMEGLFFGMRNSERLIGQRERLLALGSLSAGLTHELNNPAAAAV